MNQYIGNKHALIEDWQLSNSSVITVGADEIRPTAINWLMPGYLARGMLHLMAGKPGVGKTTLALELAATVSRGGIFPDGSEMPASKVLIWSGEDHIDSVLLPRLIVANADRSRIKFIEETQVDSSGERRPFNAATDIPKLKECAAKMGNVGLIIIDSVKSAIKTDSNSNVDVRRGLQPLVDLAAETNCVVLGLTHLTKGTAGKDPLERVTGSIAFGGLPRIVFLVSQDESKVGKERRRVITRAKSNIGPDGGGFYFEVVETEFVEDDVFSASKIVWKEAAQGTAAEILSSLERDSDPEKHSAINKAVEFLENELTPANVSATEIFRRGEENGIAKSAIYRAKKAVGVISLKRNDGWEWILPAK